MIVEPRTFHGSSACSSQHARAPGRPRRRDRRTAELGDALLEAGAELRRHLDVLRRGAARVDRLELAQSQRRVAVDVLGAIQPRTPRSGAGTRSSSTA
jgi:hypothetical protein